MLFVVPRFHTNLWFATRALVEAGHRVGVFAGRAEALEDYGHVTPRLFPPGTPRREVRAAVAELAPDLVLLRWTRPLSFQVEGLGRFGRLNIWHYDQRPLTRPRPFLKRLEWWAQGLPARRVTPKPGLDPDLPPEPGARYLPWPVAAAPGIARVPRDGPLRVLCVGKLMQRRKNQDRLIAAMAEGLAAGRMRLTLAGSTLIGATGTDAAHYRALAEAAERSGGRIALRENVPFARMPELYAAHDVCVLPSHKEPLGTAPIEAMAYGCVPVISDACGSAGYLTDGVDGFRYPVDDVAALTGILERLAADPELCDRVGAAARHLTETELSPARFIARIEALVPVAGRGAG